MKCEESMPLVEQYFDGELNEKAAARVEAHLAACVACARAHARLEMERALFLAYECDAAPASNFWDDVLAKTGATKPAAAKPAATAPPRARLRARLGAALAQFAAPRLSPALTAALIFVAIGATVALMKFGVSDESGRLSRGIARAGDRVAERAAFPDASNGDAAAQSASARNPVASNETAQSAERDAPAAERREMKEDKSAREIALESGPLNGRERKKANIVATAGGDELRAARRMTGAALPAESAADRLVREAEQKYMAAIRLLTHDVSRRRSRLTPDERARFEQTLAAVDHAIADTRRAARERPRDPVAVQYMLTAYAKKVEVLSELSRH